MAGYAGSAGRMWRLIGLLNGMMIHDGNMHLHLSLLMGSHDDYACSDHVNLRCPQHSGLSDDFLGIAKFTLGFPGVNEACEVTFHGIPLFGADPGLF